MMKNRKSTRPAQSAPTSQPAAAAPVMQTHAFAINKEQYAILEAHDARVAQAMQSRNEACTTMCAGAGYSGAMEVVGVTEKDGQKFMTIRQEAKQQPAKKSAKAKRST